ncbi:hypothetical protein GCM10009606_48190 [Nocardioides aquiterrae]|uniref:Methyltransferase domain-containing protein n=2 Tax=Nocardioides aquiterrae TaxID=203799 RepID=A0ABP4FEJ2_9ACTN
MLARVPRGCRTILADWVSAEGGHEFDTVLMRQFLHYTSAPEVALLHALEFMCDDALMYIGQLVAPSQASADWVHAIGTYLDPGRSTVFTERGLRDAVHGAGFGELVVRRFEYRESLQQWAARLRVPLAPNPLPPKLRPSPDVVRELRLGADHAISLTWLHLVVEAAA